MNYEPREHTGVSEYNARREHSAMGCDFLRDRILDTLDAYAHRKGITLQEAGQRMISEGWM